MLSTQQVDELIQIDQGRVHVSVYTDPRIYEEEMRNIFHQTWVYVGHTSEIPHPGDFKTVRVGRVPVIVNRDDSGEIRIMINSCAHQGRIVCKQDTGNTAIFRCEYHGWMYNQDGSPADVSLINAFQDEERDLTEFGLKKAPRIGIYRGLIFASLKDEGEVLDDYLGEGRHYLDAWADLSPSGEVEIVGSVAKSSYFGNWKLQLHTGTGSDDPEARGIDLGNGHFAIESIDSWQVQLFPNLILSPGRLRLLQPIVTDKTQVLNYQFILSDASILSDADRDDGPLLSDKQAGYRAVQMSPDPWVPFSLGPAPERTSGQGDAVGKFRQQVVYTAWADLMRPGIAASVEGQLAE